jgi:hypothetical protein
VAGVFVLALVGGAVHGLQRPWAYEDEQQHVDVALKLADARLAHLDDLIEPTVAESTIETGRPSRMFDPTGLDPAQWGLEGRSYAAYHPPLAPAILAPVALATGGDAWSTMVGGRVIAAFLLAASAAGVAALAARFCPSRAVTAAAQAGIAFACLPVVSDLGGRWSNDAVAVAAIVASLLAATAARREPDDRHLVWLALALAAAVGAKGTGWIAVAAAAAVAGPEVLRRRGWRAGLAVAAAPVVVGGGWALALLTRYGTVDGTAAFLDRYGAPFERRSLVEAATGQLHWSLVPQLNVDWGLPSLVPALLVVAVVGGLVALDAPGRLEPIGAVAAVAVPTAGILQGGFASGLLAPSGRFTVPLAGVALAAAAGGWSRWGLLGWAPTALCAGTGAWFVVVHPPW